MDNNDYTIEEFSLVDVAGASLTLIGGLVEDYLKHGYCDPQMYGALHLAEKLTEQFRRLAIENLEEHQDEGLVAQLEELIVNLRVTQLEAGEVMNRIIEEHDLPVEKNTFITDPTHPKARGLAKDGSQD